MPITPVVFFKEVDGSVPLLEWLERLPNKARAACLVRLELLRAKGHELRRPFADYLGERSGIYELRAKVQGVNYRMLYFFHGQKAAVVSHGFDKQRADVPPEEIESAKARKRLFEANPKAHTHEESI